VLRDEVGLTTLAPESHRCHTSGFAPSPEVVAASPLERWRESPTLGRHRAGFNVPEPAFAVLPGVVSGYDDAPLRRVIDEASRLGLELWGHAGLWCYGGEVFPELAARDLFGRPLPDTTLPWGSGFCPSRSVLHEWIKLSLVDVTRRYDLDGLFLDHARYTSPGHGPSLLTCGCPDCAAQAARRGYDMADFRAGLLALRAALGRGPAERLSRLAEAGPLETLGRLAGHDGVVDWFVFRARLLADQLEDIARAVKAAAGRPFAFGTDVFPPSVGLLGGHIYDRWARGATFFTGGFGGRIGWSTVGAVTIDNLSPWLVAWAPGLEGGTAARVVAHLIGYDPPPLGLRFDARGRVDDPEQPIRSAVAEIAAMAAARGDTPVYPPVAGGDEALLRAVCRAIAEAGLEGGMFSGLERFTAEQRAIVRRELVERRG
jgi:hypothetical protein